MKIPYLLFLIVIFFSPLAEAETWYVEKDGSGDFSVIQDAINASSSGDTIRVGAGRFNDHTIDYCTESDSPARVILNKEELTLIGSGPENTIIGQTEPWELSQGRHMGIVVGRCGNLRYSISNLKVENSFYGILGGIGTEGKIDGCVLSGHYYGCLIHSADVQINNCIFHSPVVSIPEPAQVVFFGANNFFITDCQFMSTTVPGLRTKHFINQSPAFVFVGNSSFEGGAIGVWSAGVQTSVNSCSFADLSSFGVGCNGDDVTITDCLFSGVAVGVAETNAWNHLEIERCEFNNISEATFITSLSSTGFFHDCLLEKGERFVVDVPIFNVKTRDTEKGEIPHFDMTDNWWGTTDPDSIQAWIQDGNDFPEYPFFHVIDFEPFKGVAVPVEKTSLGGLKSFFRSSKE